MLTNETLVNTTKTPDNEDNADLAEKVRIVHVIVRPILVILGTFGNLLSFYVMRRGSLKHVSTCFYMSVLAIADTGKIRFSFNAGALEFLP